MQFTDDEIETIKSIILEHGCDCPGTDSDKVKELEYKLGLSIRPTPEELAAHEKRMQEWRESDSGKAFVQALSYHNHLLEDISGTPDVLFGSMKIGSQLRIRLPNDYNIKPTRWQKFKNWWSNVK